MERVDALDQLRGAARGDGQAAGPPGHQFVDLPQDLEGVPSLDLPELDLQAGGPQRRRRLPGPGGRVLHGGRLRRLEDGPQPEALPGPDQGLPVGVGPVAQLLRDLADAGRHLGVDPPPVVEGPVHRPPGDAGQLGDLL